LIVGNENLAFVSLTAGVVLAASSRRPHSPEEGFIQGGLNDDVPLGTLKGAPQLRDTEQGVYVPPPIASTNSHGASVTRSSGTDLRR
jgi:hypothetical protein